MPRHPMGSRMRYWRLVAVLGALFAPYGTCAAENSFVRGDSIAFTGDRVHPRRDGSRQELFDNPRGDDHGPRVFRSRIFSFPDVQNLDAPSCGTYRLTLERTRDEESTGRGYSSDSESRRD